MIYIDRSTVPIPKQLTSPRANAAREKIAELLKGPREHLDQTRIRFDSQIYMAARPALVELFHRKCAYCESSFLHIGLGDVEHFRPKMGVDERDGTRSHYYYAWLAYEWENLLIVCTACNMYRGKGTKFPIQGSRARLLASVEECRATE